MHHRGGWSLIADRTKRTDCMLFLAFDAIMWSRWWGSRSNFSPNLVVYHSGDHCGHDAIEDRYHGHDNDPTVL